MQDERTKEGLLAALPNPIQVGDLLVKTCAAVNDTFRLLMKKRPPAVGTSAGDLSLWQLFRIEVQTLKAQPANTSTVPVTSQEGTEGPVLLVESYALLARPLLWVLAEEGICAHHARNWSEAIALTPTATHAAFLVNWRVTGGCGFTLVQRWREQGLAAPVLLFVPDTSGEHRLRAMEVGANDCLPLPFCLEDVLSRLLVWTGRQKQV